MRRLLPWSIVIVLLAGGASLYLFAMPSQGLPWNIKRAMLRAQKFEFVTVDPSHEFNPSATTNTTTQTMDLLRGYRVLGRAPADATTREALLQALDQSIREGDMHAACFDPRHAIHAEVDGKVIDILICFHCQGYELYEGDVRKHGAMSRTAEEAFKEAVEKLRLPAAK